MNTRCYRSKIGRLPFAIRNELNERIRDGAQGPELLEWLNGLKEMRKILREMKSGPVNAQNLTDWRSSGYNDWLEDQKDADRIRRLAEVSQTLASASGGNVASVGCNIAAAKIMDALESAEDDKIADWLADQKDADRIRRLAEVSQTLAAAAGGNVAGVGCSIATAKIMDALESADDDKIADLSTALVKLRTSENAAQKVALAEEKNALAKEQLELSRAKFERDTTRLFIKWAQSKDAIALATDRRLGSDEKTERLGRLMFGDLWEGATDGR